MTNNTKPIRLFLANITFIFFTLLTTLVTAQQQPQLFPIPVQDLAGTRSGSDFLIQGGKSMVNGTKQFGTSQFWALDLSTSWSTTSPPWRPLSNGTISTAFYGFSNPTNTTFSTITFLSPTSLTLSKYDVNGNMWSLPQAITTVTDLFSYGIPPVVDSSTGLVYIAGIGSLNVLDPVKNTWTGQPILAGVLTARYFGTVNWDPVRKQILWVGGYNYGVNNTHFDPVVVVTRYVPATMQWSQLNTTGTPPSPAADLCSAITEDGKTLVVFGGRTSIVTPTFVGTLYMLDIATGVWTTGPSQSPRIYAVCTTVGDQFLVWGGSPDANNTITNVAPLVFDLISKQWVTSYKAPAYYANSPPKTVPTNNNLNGGSSSSGSGGSGSSSSSSMGPIIGGVVGGLALIGIAVGFIFYRKRQNKRTAAEERDSQRRMFSAEVEQSSRVGGGGGHGSGSGGYDDGGQSSIENSNTTITPPTSMGYYSPKANNNNYINNLLATTGSNGIPNSSPLMMTSNNLSNFSQHNISQNHPHDMTPTNYINPHMSPPSPVMVMMSSGPQYDSSTKPSPQVMYMAQGKGSSNANNDGNSIMVSGPQAYSTTTTTTMGTSRAPQGIVFKNNDISQRQELSAYHQQDSGSRTTRPNHPQEGIGADFGPRSPQHS